MTWDHGENSDLPANIDDGQQFIFYDAAFDDTFARKRSGKACPSSNNMGSANMKSNFNWSGDNDRNANNMMA
jgi:hypothetical protein